MQREQLLRDCEEMSADWLKALEQAKRLYRQYAAVSELYKLPRVRRIKMIRYRPPSLEHPLTTNRLSGWDGGFRDSSGQPCLMLHCADYCGSSSYE